LTESSKCSHRSVVETPKVRLGQHYALELRLRDGRIAPKAAIPAAEVATHRRGGRHAPVAL
jgi:hypothetical protein